jgi:hypothetical protein
MLVVRHSWVREGSKVSAEDSRKRQELLEAFSGDEA